MDDHWDKWFGCKQGYSEAQLKECLEEYAALNVWQIDPNTFDIRFIWIPTKKETVTPQNLETKYVLLSYYLMCASLFSITFLNLETVEADFKDCKTKITFV